MFYVSRIIPGANNQPMIQLHSENSSGIITHQVTVYCLGATITSYINNGEEQLYLSPQAIFNGTKAIRGGIPIVFPQFGTVPGSQLNQHGFARNSNWKLIETKTTLDSAMIILTLSSNEVTMIQWPHEFNLQYRICLNERCLSTDLFITNNSSLVEFSFQALQHTYIKVHSIKNVQVAGFAGLQFIDKLSKSDSGTENREIITIEEGNDRIYSNLANPQASESTILIRNVTESLTSMRIDSSSSILSPSGESLSPSTLIEEGCIAHDIVLWNPWIEKSKTMADLPDDAYLSFLCIEPGLVSRWVNLPPLKTCKLSQILTRLKD